MFLSEFKLVEGKENNKKCAQQIIDNAKELEADFEKKNQEIQILQDKIERLEDKNRILEDEMASIKDQNTNLNTENEELREKCSLRLADKEKLDDKVMKTERHNIKLLCDLKKVTQDRDKFEKGLNERTEEIQEMKKNFSNLTKQNISHTKTLLEVYR